VSSEQHLLLLCALVCSNTEGLSSKSAGVRAVRAKVVWCCVPCRPVLSPFRLAAAISC